MRPQETKDVEHGKNMLDRSPDLSLERWRSEGAIDKSLSGRKTSPFRGATEWLGILLSPVSGSREGIDNYYVLKSEAPGRVEERGRG